MTRRAPPLTGTSLTDTSLADISDAHANPPLAVSLLSPLLGVLGARHKGRVLLERLGIRRLARHWLRANVVNASRDQADDVTVLIGIRNRTDHRLALALRSIREQQYPAALVHAVVVDYGSEPEAADHAAAICREYGATHLRVETSDVWSRSRCLNVGVRRLRTKFVLSSDVDIMFSPAYIAEAVRALRDAPLSVVCSLMLDLPEHTEPLLRHTGEHHAPLQLHEWKASSTRRFDWPFHPSIAMTYTRFYQIIRGYDEWYQLWGSEDADLFRRLTKLGLDGRVLSSDDAFYLHQWHPKHESIPVAGREQLVQRNEARHNRVQTIVRNDASWGRRKA